MNTSLGLNFLRIVNEKGSNGWSQVYIRVPFDVVEVQAKGALFGCIFGKDLSSWADTEVEMMTWVDEYLNGLSVGGNLAEFFEEWQKKYSDLSCVWLWVNLINDDKREIKIVKWGEAGVFLKKDNKNIDLTKNIEEGKVIKGGVNEGDVLYLWTGILSERYSSLADVSDEEEKNEGLNSDLVERSLAASGITLKIERVIKEELLGLEDSNRIILVPDQKVIEKQLAVGPVINEEKTENETRFIGRNTDDSELVRNRYVGPIGFKEKLFNWWNIKFNSKKREIRIENDSSKRKKWAIILGVGFLLLLLVSVVTGSLKMKRDSEEKKWRSFYEPIEKGRQEAEELVKLNPVGARKMMEDVRSTFDLKKAEFLKGKYKNEIILLEKKINDSWTITSGERASEIDEVVKIDLVRQGFGGDRMSITPDGKLLVIDTKMGVATNIEIKTKDIRVVAGKEASESWVDISGEDKKTLIMTTKGVKNIEQNKEVITFDSAVLGPVALGRFVENVYILDNQNKEIYKYAVSTEGYGARSRWLKQGQSIGLTPVDMAIDADIWIADENGQVDKFRRGVKELFTMSGLPVGAKIGKIAVEIEGTRIALLDANAGMIIICSKESGNCSQQLKNNKLKTARDIEFGTDGGLYVLLPGVIGKIQ